MYSTTFCVRQVLCIFGGCFSMTSNIKIFGARIENHLSPVLGVTGQYISINLTRTLYQIISYILTNFHQNILTEVKI
jgi:hypothetical protein